MFLIPNENICRDEFGMLEMVVLILYNIKLGSACETSKRKAVSRISPRIVSSLGFFMFNA